VEPKEQGQPLAALVGLLGLFRAGQISAPSLERKGIDQYVGLLTAEWNRRFPGFPSEYFPYTSFQGQYHRRQRDAHLKDIIVRILRDRATSNAVVVNPACVFGRHAAEIADRLPAVRVVGADIDAEWYRMYQTIKGFRIPPNCSFERDNIFASRLDVRPTAVVFFGACGSVSDGGMDYAIDSGARFLMCRTCCQDNIGGNTVVVPRPNPVNLFFRLKNWGYGRMKIQPKYQGFYFCDRYARDAYPRSKAAQGVSNSDEFQSVARHSVDSDICRTIIDLDRYLYLTEHGFRVMYQGELFVAERRGPTD
jgi:hypothetical protein